MDGDDHGLSVLLPQVAAWFRATFGAPTPPQRMGWPEIAAGRSTLIFAPTGSGKTLAAFLACLDYLWRTPRQSSGVRIVYVSPLKALNYDIERNLQEPLTGILAAAEAAGAPLDPLRVAVRTGDTPAAQRQKLVRKPPDILITTPESLNLMLTSSARHTLRSVSHVIVDEIHALCPNKRGVFLALLLERLEALNPQSFVRVGLSATQRPLEEVARYLGGLSAVDQPGGALAFKPRPVTIVDTGQRRELDLEVIVPAGLGGGLRAGGFQPAGSVWPAIEERVFDLIQEHRSTIVFANGRRVAERLTAHLNQLAGQLQETARALDTPVDRSDAEDIIAPEHDLVPVQPVEIARAHHGSLSLEERRATEEALKQGELPAVVATSSLELGIDMG
ncbi:MAG TPA: DEAD/DEAH box helicase, partial [Isosphaeraceae bacterium]|nr:DEAD/DEAH box helicase [Isosphaeraceae bacterium]